MNKNDEKVRVSKGTLKTAKRLLGYVTSRFKVQFFAVFICIIISSIASISVSLSLKFLLDDFIIPLIGQESPDFSELYMALGVLGTIFLAGVIYGFPRSGTAMLSWFWNTDALSNGAITKI